jgi:hypothetical protein
MSAAQGIVTAMDFNGPSLCSNNVNSEQGINERAYKSTPAHQGMILQGKPKTDKHTKIKREGLFETRTESRGRWRSRYPRLKAQTGHRERRPRCLFAEHSEDSVIANSQYGVTGADALTVG